MVVLKWGGGWRRAPAGVKVRASVARSRMMMGLIGPKGDLCEDNDEEEAFNEYRGGDRGFS